MIPSPLRLALLVSAVCAGSASAQAPKPPPPTFANVSYGPSTRQVLDFYQAKSNKPTPVVIFIHGGSWLQGNKMPVTGLTRYLEAGISVVSIEYRLVSQAQAAKVKPPVQWPLHDAARAVQFVRSQAREWKINPARIGLSGSSAGACSCLWVAFHPDLAQPQSDDPIERESTRVYCVGAIAAQTTLDPLEMKEWTPNSNYGGHAFGFNGDPRTHLTSFQQFLRRREEIREWIAEYSPYELASAGAPPIYLYYAAPPALGKPQKDPTHSANFGVMLQHKLRDLGVECELVYPDAPDTRHPTAPDYLIDKLKQ